MRWRVIRLSYKRLKGTTVSLNAKLGAYWMELKFMSCTHCKQSYSTQQLTIVIIQHIVTVPKYGHGTLDIRRGYSQQIFCDIRNSRIGEKNGRAL